MSEFTVKIIPYQLKFKRPAGTSRGVYHVHDIWYVVLQSRSDASHWGIGECAPLFDLSCDYDEDYEKNLRVFCEDLENTGKLDKEVLRPYPSILFGLETALTHYKANSFKFWDSPFSNGLKGIPINGLIWMGEYSEMKEQIEEKLKIGFRCIKLKIGAINFDDELRLIEQIRKDYSSDRIELRVDANGAFPIHDAMHKLNQLAQFDLHSIEQPIKAGQWSEMAKLTHSTPLPIALDEELIGVNNPEKKRQLLETINPQYIILKPTLHGGFSGAKEWIDLANDLSIKWWITSALESNIGLNAIAQWSATLENELPQGLGTGGLYTNNIEMPLTIREDCLWIDKAQNYPTINDFR